jgi:HlyD family secretion protein
MSRRTLRILPPAVLVALALGGLAVSGGSKDTPRYLTETVTRGDIESVVSCTGEVDPLNMVEISSEVSGLVAKVNVDVNARVRKGEVLAELDRAPFEDDVRQNEAGLKLASAALEKANVALETARKKYERTLALFEKKLLSLEEKEADEAAYLEAKDDQEMARSDAQEAAAELEESRIALEKTRILAPMDGIILTRNVNPGQTVAARYDAPVLFTLADDLRTMRLQCRVDEADVGRVREGQRVEFTVEAYPADVFACRVIQIQDDALTDSDVVRYPVLGEVDNSGGRLRPGMTATVTIHTGSVHDVLRVPNRALQFVPPVLTDDMNERLKRASRDVPAGQVPSFVWTVDAQGRLTPVLVRTGMAGPVLTEIQPGPLKEGQAVVTGTAAR